MILILACNNGPSPNCGGYRELLSQEHERYPASRTSTYDYEVDEHYILWNELRTIRFIKRCVLNDSLATIELKSSSFFNITIQDLLEELLACSKTNFIVCRAHISKLIHHVDIAI
jgi:hypothetical protein